MSSDPFSCIKIHKYMAYLFIYRRFQIDGINDYSQLCIERLCFVRDLDISTKLYLASILKIK